MLKQIAIAMVLSVSLSTLAGLTHYGGGSGTSESPFEIWTAEQLNSIGTNPDDWNKHFKLMDNIDMSIYNASQFNIIAPSCQRLFGGTFDGNNKTISNLSYTTNSDKSAGMFGCIKNATIKNLILDNVSILSEGLYSNTGGLAGSNEYSTIINCHITGSVIGNNHVGGLIGSNSSGVLIGCSAAGSVSGTGYLGGLVGVNSGNAQITSCSAANAAHGTGNYVGGMMGWNFSDRPIINCYATGTVVAGGYFAGGLIGSNEGSGWGDDGDITGSMLFCCYATGSVSGIGDIGGLVGENYNTLLRACYATGSVYGTDGVGGLTGDNNSSTATSCYATGSVQGTNSVGGLAGINSGEMVGCYAAGLVDGMDSVGGLVGTNSHSELSNCFWDVQTTGQADGIGNPDPSEALGKSTAQMKTLSTFISAGWDFVEVWGIGNGQTYPYLKGTTGFKPADSNYSGSVDLQDLAILAGDWLE